MKHYELMYLVPAQVPETELESIQKQVSDMISKSDGKVSKVETWGRKKLAYPINNERFGYYLIAEFDIEPENLTTIQKDLKLHKQIVRYLLLDKKPLSEKELKRQEQAKKRAHLRAAREDTKSRKSDVHGGGVSSVRKESASKKDSKISLDDLDKKLDELLDTDIIK